MTKRASFSPHIPSDSASLYYLTEDIDLKPQLIRILREKSLESIANSIEDNSCREIYPTTRRSSKHQYQTHFTRIGIRTLNRGCKNPFQIYLEQYHDTVEYLVSTGMNPLEAVLKVERNIKAFMARQKNNDLNFTSDELLSGVILLSRPFFYDEEKEKFVENKKDESYLARIVAPSSQPIILYERTIAPRTLDPVVLFAKAGDKEDNLDNYFFEKILDESKSNTAVRNLYEGYLLRRALRDLPNPREESYIGMHPSYTLEFYSEDYVNKEREGFETDLNKLYALIKKSEVLKEKLPSIINRANRRYHRFKNLSNSYLIRRR